MSDMMTAEQLKGSILQLAMQGKLVEQRTNEREVVFKKGKGKETEEIDFEIPMSWKTAHLETVVDSVASKQYQIKESEVKAEGKYRVISQSKEYSIGYCNDNPKLYHHTQPVIVFGDHTTEVKFIDFDFVVGADGIKIFNPNTDIIEPRFLFYQLQFYTRGLNKVGGYSRHYKFIKNKPVVIPPHAEQKRIVAKIEELMPFVEQYAAASTKLNTLNASFPEMMKKSILQEAVQGKLVPQDPNDEPASLLLKKNKEEKKRLIKEGKIKKPKPLPEITEDEIPFDIPESWEWVRFENAVDMLSGFAFKSSDFVQDGEYRLLRGINLGVDEVRWDDTVYVNSIPDKLSIYQLKKGDVLLGLDRPWISNGIRVAVFDGLENTYLVQRVLRIREFGVLSCEYVALILRSSLLSDVVQGQTTGISVPHISPKQVGSIAVPVPPVEEQKRIVEKVKLLCTEIDSLRQ